MITPRLLVSTVGLALAAFSCAPPCESITPAPQSVCHRADAGTITPDASFILEGTTFVQGGACRVTIDGGQIDLVVDGMSCAATGSANGLRAPQAPATVRCTIPALPAGSYVVTASTATTFTIPESGDAGLPPCL